MCRHILGDDTFTSLSPFLYPNRVAKEWADTYIVYHLHRQNLFHEIKNKGKGCTGH